MKDVLMKRRYALVGGGAALTLLLDQLTKWLVLIHIPQHHSIPLISGFFDLVHVRNRGAAFGFLNRSDIDWQIWLFGGATLVAAWAIIMLTRTAKEDTRLFCGLGLILGGALGNLIDRIRFREVIDFLDVYVGTWHWPAFNVADIAICLGALLACLSLWRAEAHKGKDA